MSFPTITPLPDPPRRGAGNDEAFAQAGDDFMGALPGFQAEMNEAGAYVDDALAQMEDLLQSGGFTGTSTSSVVIGVGAKALTTQPNLAYVPGSLVSVADTAAPATNLMLGTVTAYNSSTGLLNFTVAAGDVYGSGTKTAWSISLSGPRGPVPTGTVDTSTAQDVTGRKAFIGGGSGMATATTGLGAMEIRASATGAAMVELNRNGTWRAYFGFDTDNVLKVGGGSMGPVAYTLWHSGNDGSGSGLDADLLRGQVPTSAGSVNTAVTRGSAGESGFFIVDTPIVRNGGGNLELQYGSATKLIVGSSGITAAQRLYIGITGAPMYLEQAAVNDVRMFNGAGTPIVKFDGGSGELYGFFNGNFNDVYIRSDRRLKSKYSLVGSDLGEKLDQLSVYRGLKRRSLDEEGEGALGYYLIEDEVRQVFPELTSQPSDTNSPASVNYLGVVSLLLAEVQFLRRRTEVLERDRS